MTDVYSMMLLPAVIAIKIILSFIFSTLFVQGVSWTDAGLQWRHPSMEFDEQTTRLVSDIYAQDYDDFNKTLDKILIPRVPGSNNHRKVQKFIIDTMNDLNWHIEQDTFTAATPHGEKPFNNIIATLNPTSCRRLVLACHYDSLVSRENTFVGATDSAVPCSMMINMVKVLDGPLKAKQDEDLTLQLLFFDGEEAFEQWSKTDSLYGSRHLAELWNKTPFPTSRSEGKCKNKDYASTLDRIDVFILLDLLGGANPRFYSFFLDTHSLYQRLVGIEARLNKLGLMENEPPQSKTNYFKNRSTFSLIEDDHIPFLKRNVPIIHVIPSPFPPVWHRESDNRANLHHPTINNLNKIFKVFIAEYLHLDVNIRS